MYQLCTSTTWIKVHVYVNFVRFIHLLFFFHHLHDNRFWGERFLIEMIIFANFKTWKEPPEITNLHIIWFIQFDISRRIKIDKKNQQQNKQTNKQTVDFLKKMVVDYICASTGQQLYNQNAPSISTAKKLGDSFFLRLRQNGHDSQWDPHLPIFEIRTKNCS